MTATTSHISPERAHILIVDDEIRMIQSLERLLEKHHTVTTALGGNSACQKLLQQKFDLVLLDLNMQDKDGHSVMAFMADNQIETATIVVSGESSFTAVSKALRRGAYDYLKKPYDPEELLATINSALKQKSLKDAHWQMQLRLKRSEELHRYIVNSSPDIVFMLDQQGRFTFLNSKVEALLGHQKTELIGQSYQKIIHPQDKDKASYYFRIPSTKEHPVTHSARENKNTIFNNEEIKSFEIHFSLKDEPAQSRCFEVTIFPIERKVKALKGLLEEQQYSRKYMGLYGTARDITERKEAENFINFQAYHDLLTRLPNRALFKDRLSLATAQSRRNKSKLAVMFLDLDRFKVVNDTLGHAMGDRLLQSVTTRLCGCIREGDTLARFGGDEFTLLLPEIANREDARGIARKIIQELREPFTLGEHEVFVGVSIGIAMYPDTAKTVDELIQNADAAMYHVKGRGKDGYQFFVNSMNNRCSSRLTLERDLRLALENNQLKVYYQPQINAQSGNIIGVEALVRWHHPERGIIYPSEFLPLAEETRLIVDISEWVLATACREVKQWIDHGLRDLRLAVNLSPKQFEHPRFVNMLVAKLQAINFPPKNLELEITENVIMNDLERMIQKLSLLSKLGVSIAIDDFGTGYSSLSYIHKLPIHTLKVDQSFVRDLHNQLDEACIVNAIIAMAKGLKLNIVAEGVETADQYAYLKALGCHEIQGFLFGKAQPAAITFDTLTQKARSATA